MIPKKKPKIKTPKLSTLVDKADKVCSIYIRMKYSDHAGYIECCTCKKPIRWQDAHCAHYIERGKYRTRWREENLHPACPGCNVFNKEFHKREYSFYMLDMYGRDLVEELKADAKRLISPSEKRQLALEAITYYQEAVKSL